MKTMFTTIARPSLIVTLLAAAFSSHAATRVSLDNNPAFASFANNTSLHATLGLLPTEIESVRSQQYANGKVVTRLQQVYQGVPVWGEVIVQHRDGKQTVASGVSSLSGAVLQGIAQDVPSTRPMLSKELVLQQAKARALTTKTELEQVKLYIKQAENGRAQLVYLVSFIASDAAKPSRPFFLIDANNGSVLHQWEGIAHRSASGPGGNVRTGQYEYGRDKPALVVSQNCVMDSPYVTTYDMSNSTTSGTPYKFNCPRNTYKAVNGAFSPLNDAHAMGHTIVEMYQNWFGIAPLKQKLVMRVHYGNNYPNAFWDGRAMTFGDGDASMYPLTLLDVGAHEISHGFTEQNAGLMYPAQAAAIGESFSDMAGEAAKYYATGKNNFELGAIFKNGKSLRYLNNPPKDGYSIEHAAKFVNTMDIHYSSGVYNKAFYLLTTRPGWNTRKAFEVMVDANRLYWGSGTDFNNGACGVIKAADNRGYRINDVRAAFAAVGVACPLYK